MVQRAVEGIKSDEQRRYEVQAGVLMALKRTPDGRCAALVNTVDVTPSTSAGGEV